MNFSKLNIHSFIKGLIPIGLLLVIGSFLLSANSNNSNLTFLTPSLLIDVSLPNATPGSSDQFCYKIRYRCNSTTEHCTDAYIDVTFPDGIVIGSLPSLGGNITAVTETAGVPTGTNIKVDLETPASAGLPPATLAAGSSGIFEVCLVWECLPEGDTQIPSPGTSINLVTAPTFYASGTSTVANASDIVVPIFNTCNPSLSSSGGFKKTKPSATKKINPGGSAPFLAVIPANTDTLVFTDMFDTTSFLLSNVELPDPNWTLEILCDTSWYVIPNTYQDLSDWLAANATAGTLSNLEVNGVQTGCSADTNAVTASSNGYGYVTDISGLRITTLPTTSLTYTDFLFIVKDSVPVGSSLSNCFVYEDTLIGNICSDEYEIVAESSLTNLKTVRSGIGNLNVPTYPAGLPAKQADDILWELRWGVPDANANATSGFLLSDTLPLGLTFDPDPVNGNWSSTFLAGNFTVPAPYDMSDQSACHNPIFTSSVLPDGRTLLEWDYTTCTSYPGFGFHSRPQVFFTTRFDRNYPLPTSFTNCSAFGFSDGTPVWCGVGNGATTEQMCRDCAIFAIPSSGGAIHGKKSVKGLLDASYSVFPNYGDTDFSGDGTYEILIEISDLEGIKKMDIVDILPHIGDFTLSPRVARQSEWSVEISGPLVVEKFDIITQTWVPVTSEITNELYATTYNPCYMDASLQVKTQTGLIEPASAGCSSSDFSTTNPAIGATAFAITWENTTDPLLFGEALRIQLPFRQLTGEADPANGAIAWNSFAVTGTQPDDDELFSSEPLKVGVQILTADNVSIGNKVWEDANANGIQDPNEAPIAGVTVSLFDNAGTPIMMGGQAVQAITDQYGNYQFSGLDPNTTYLVRLDELTDFNNSGPLSNMNLTQPNQGIDDELDSDAALLGNFPSIYALTGAADSNNESFDFGFYQGATICGYAWEDSNSDGIQDFIENGVDSVQLELVNSGGAVIATTETNTSGMYSFANVIPGTYTIQVTLLSSDGYIFTSPNATSNDNLDSDVDLNNSIGQIFLEGGDNSCNHDVGLILPIPNAATIIGTVWDELIMDGVQDINEIGVVGIQVNLLDATQFVIATTYTDQNGDYIFNNLTPNEDYFVNVIPGVTNPLTSPQDVGTDDTIDSDVDPVTGTTFVITPAPGETVNHVDAGIVFPYTIGNQVWLDGNDNGIFDAGEGIVPGVTIHLIDASTGTYLNTTITDLNGKFIFTDLQPGDYYLELELLNNLTSTDDISSSTTPNAADSDDNGTGVMNTNLIQSSIVTITAGGGAPGDPNWVETDHGLPINGVVNPTSNPKAYYTVDFGLKYKLDCSVPMVQYAITNGGISKPSQTTDYFYTGTTQNLKTLINHVPMAQQDGVIRCYDYCDFGQWTYYFNPMDPDEYLFAIEHGTNVTPIEYIELRVAAVPTSRYAIGTNDATFVMARDWFVRTVNDAPLLDVNGVAATVNIRFYFPEEEYKEILDAAVAEATAWGGNVPTAADVYWFKRDAFDPTANIDMTGSMLTPFDITGLRNSSTTALGVNTSDGIAGQRGNGKNHIQFNGITGFSGGTAAITINRSALPIAIASFEAEELHCSALLKWQVESATNFSHYVIERSFNGVDYEVLGQLSGGQVVQESYQYLDETVSGNVFYRLKMIDLDGSIDYSNIINANLDCDAEVSALNLYPNPVDENQTSVNLKFQSKSEQLVWIHISNSYGNDLMKFPVDAIIGTNILNIDISNLNQGTFLVSLKGEKGKLVSSRFIKIRK